MTTITGTVTTTVELDIGAYDGPLTIATGGAIRPAGGGAIGLLIRSNAAGGSVLNQGLILGGTGGAGTLNGGVTRPNGGTIAATSDAVSLTTQGTLDLFDSVKLTGDVVATPGGGDLLILDRVAGTLTGLGTSITGFDNVMVKDTAAWTLANGTSLSAGTTLTDNGSLTFAGSVTGPGTLVLGSYGALTLDSPKAFAATIHGFAANDKIDLVKLLPTSASFANGTLTLLHGTATVGTLAFAGSYTTADFTLASDFSGGTEITFGGAAPASAAHTGLGHAGLVEPAVVDGAWFAHFGHLAV